MRLESIFLAVLVAPLYLGGLPAAGNYYYETISGIKVFATLEEAQQELRSGPPPSGNLSLVDTSVSVDGGPVKYTFDLVPNNYPPGQEGPYFDGQVCDNGPCGSASSIVEQVASELRSHPLVCEATAQGVGSYQFPRVSRSWRWWPESLPPHEIYQYHTAFGSVRYIMRLSVDSECNIDNPYTSSVSVQRIRKFSCEEGYTPLVFPDETLPPRCQANLTQTVYGPVTQECNETVGNPCNALSGNKAENVVDYNAEGLEFERAYNSSQMN